MLRCGKCAFAGPRASGTHGDVNFGVGAHWIGRPSGSYAVATTIKNERGRETRVTPKIPVEDRLDIHDLIARYAWALDVGDEAGYLDCFLPDATMEHHPPGKVQGHDAIRGLVHFLWYEHPKDYLGRQHRMSQVLMTPEGEGVRIKAFWSILQHFADERNEIYGLGTWDALARRCEDGQWRLASLYVDIWRGDNVPWVGDKRAWDKRSPASNAA